MFRGDKRIRTTVGAPVPPPDARNGGARPPNPRVSRADSPICPHNIHIITPYPRRPAQRR